MGCPDTSRQSFEWWHEDQFNSNCFKESLKLAFADQLIHSDSPPKNMEDLRSICREAEKLAGISSSGNEWLSPVGHLANYGSCYYSYILADTIADKILSRYQFENSFGVKLRHDLFSKGGTVSLIEQLDALGITVLD
jgi:Zn-dependent oligopeptidase